MIFVEIKIKQAPGSIHFVMFNFLFSRYQVSESCRQSASVEEATQYNDTESDTTRTTLNVRHWNNKFKLDVNTQKLTIQLLDKKLLNYDEHQNNIVHCASDRETKRLIFLKWSFDKKQKYFYQINYLTQKILRSYG